MKLFTALSTMLVLATPALADTCTTQTPPSPASSMGPSSPCNSLPPGEATAQFPTFGESLTVTRFGRAIESVPARPAQPQAATPKTLPVLTGSE